MITRRTFGKAAIAMTIPGMGGQTPPRPDQQYAGRQGAVVVAPGSTNVVRARLVIVSGSGPGSGIFVYSGPPALGNLIASIAATAGTDIFGNAYLAGVVSYVVDNLLGGAFNGTYALDVGIVSGNSAPGLSFSNRTTLAALDPSITGFSGGASGAVLELFSGIGSAGTGSALILDDTSHSGITNGVCSINAGRVFLGELHGSNCFWDDNAGTTGQFNLAAGTGPFISGEGWHAASLANATASGNNVNGLKYQLRPDNRVQMLWDLTPTNNAGSVMFTIPAAYQPATQQTFDSGWYGNGPAAYSRTFAPRLQVATSGGVSYQGTNNIVAGMNLCGNVIYSLTV